MALKSFVREKAILSSSQTIVVVKSLYPQVDVQAVGEGFVANCTKEDTLALMVKAQGAAAALVENIEL
ncbi:hypothetical protein E2562_036106 [Oryza meyeriana var. granulata]|uniref:Uncharacterized protein n=1 Tax=Oryza meyeriana var. granulata TaxID=110450 RepID=A0A6G1DSP4_9ORYZ|nr:hypothetical protein E2562_036106 [Oryza meyeriana var. granulata]